MRTVFTSPWARQVNSDIRTFSTILWILGTFLTLYTFLTAGDDVNLVKNVKIFEKASIIAILSKFTILFIL